jgi:hypothetical protein
MKSDEKIQQQIEETLNSIDNIQKATPPPYLLTRINARLNNPAKNIWENIAIFISRPAVTIAGICLLVTINISALVLKKAISANPVAEHSSTTIADEEDEYTNLATIDYIENQ